MIGKHVSYTFLSINLTFFVLLAFVAAFTDLDESTNRVLWITLGITLFNIVLASVVITYLKTHDVSFE